MRSVPKGHVTLKELVIMLVEQLHGKDATASLDGAIEGVETKNLNPVDDDDPKIFTAAYVEVGGKKIRLHVLDAMWDDCRERVWQAFMSKNLEPQIQTVNMTSPRVIDLDYWPLERSKRALVSGRYDEPHPKDKEAGAEGCAIFFEEDAAKDWLSRIQSEGETQTPVSSKQPGRMAARFVEEKLTDIKKHGEPTPGQDSFWRNHIKGKFDMPRWRFREVYKEKLEILGMEIRGSSKK